MPQANKPISKMSEAEKLNLQKTIGEESYWQRVKTENRKTYSQAYDAWEAANQGRASNNPLPKLTPKGQTPIKGIHPLNRTAPSWTGRIPSPDLKKPYQAMEKLARNGVKTTTEHMRGIGKAIANTPSPNLPRIFKELANETERGIAKAGTSQAVKAIKSGATALAKGAKGISALGLGADLLLDAEPFADATIDSPYGKLFGALDSQNIDSWAKSLSDRIEYPQGDTVVTPAVYPFRGGQTTGTLYNVEGEQDFLFRVNSNTTPISVTCKYRWLNVPGKISTNTTPENTFPLEFGGNPQAPPSSIMGGTNGYPVYPYQSSPTLGWNSYTFNTRIFPVRITSIVRVDGQPDTGGDPAPTAPATVVTTRNIALPDNFSPARQQPVGVIDGEEIFEALAPLLSPPEPTRDRPKVAPVPSKPPLDDDEDDLTPLPREISAPSTMPVPSGGESTVGYPQPNSGRNPQYDPNGNPVRPTNQPVVPLRNTTQGNPPASKITPSDSPVEQKNFKDPYLPFAPPIPKLNQPPIKIDPITAKPSPGGQKTPPPIQTPSPPDCGCNAPLIAGQQSILDRLNSGTQIPGQVLDLSLLNVINNKLGDQIPGGIGGFMTKAWRATRMDKVINALTLVAALHNAAMLSRSLGDTLSSAIDNALVAFNLKDENEDPLNINNIIGTSVSNFFKSILGEEVYNDAVSSWKRASRIYQSAANVISISQGLFWSVKEVIEETGERVGKIGNALRKSGTVMENSYNWMSEKLNISNGRLGTMQKVVDGLQSAENVTSDIDSITSELREVGELSVELRQQTLETKQLIEQGEPEPNRENIPIKTKQETIKANSKAPEFNDVHTEADEDDTP